MASIGKKLDSLTLRAVSPDGRIRITVKGGGNDVALEFKPKEYEEYYKRKDSQIICDQMRKALILIVNEFIRTHNRIFEDHGYTIYSPDRPHWHAQKRLFIEEKSQIKASGISNDRIMRVRSVGMRKYDIAVKQGDWIEQDEEAFKQTFLSAVKNMQRDYRQKVHELKLSILGPEIFAR